jgi:hypothetical protein
MTWEEDFLTLLHLPGERPRLNGEFAKIYSDTDRPPGRHRRNPHDVADR